MQNRYLSITPNIFYKELIAVPNEDPGDSPMKMLPLLLMLCLVSPALAAGPEKEAAAPASQEQIQPGANATQQAPTEDFSCKYYKVKLPSGWKAIVPPEEQLGNVNAIFATETGSSVVTMVAGPSSGEDAQTIASMFAEQFKSRKPPVLSNGMYTFQFNIQNSLATAYVASYDGNFMLTYIAGNMKPAQKFIREAITSDTWPGLLPR